MSAKPKQAAKKPRKRKSVGRPTRYDARRNDEVRNYCMLGATNEDLAQLLEVSLSAVESWIARHDEFKRAIKAGREVADAKVTQSLYHRATGYSHPEDKVFNNDGVPLVVPTIKHYPPSEVACIFWLKNRRPQDWRDKKEVDANIKHSLIGDILEEAMHDD